MSAYWPLLLLGLLVVSSGAAKILGTHKLRQPEELDKCNDPEEVCSLPGFNGHLASLMRSGYIQVSEASNRNLWYIMVDSQREPSRGPVVLWLTGGPGCSSLDAFMYEHGPFTFSRPRGVEGQAGPIRITQNPYSWSKVATIIYVDSPAGTGWSYSDAAGDYRTTDDLTTQDLVTFLIRLFDKHPGLWGRPLYLAGESYGGVYVPMLADQLLNWNYKAKQAPTDGSHRREFNLQGYLVGNGVTDDEVDGNAQFQFARDMGYLDPITYLDMDYMCQGTFWNATPGTRCGDLVGQVWESFRDLNRYDVLQPCTQQPAESALADKAFTTASTPLTQQQRQAGSGLELQDRSLHLRRPRQGADAAGQLAGSWRKLVGHVVPCGDRSLAIEYWNRADVRQALHAESSKRIGAWTPCSDVLEYRMDTARMVPLHKKLLKAGLRALIYSGDHDMVVPHTGTRQWVFGLGHDLRRPFGPWYMHHQIAGYLAQFTSGLSYATFKGGGHMVPQTSPAAALELLTRFLEDDL